VQRLTSELAAYQSALTVPGRESTTVSYAPSGAGAALGRRPMRETLH
jgi:hypothetical protein